MRQEPKLFSSGNAAPPPQDGFRVEPRRAPAPGPDPEHEDTRPGSGRGFPWRLILGIVALAVVGLVVWQGAGLFTGNVGSSGNQVPVFQASVDPFKHRPDDPGGMAVPNQNVTVYNTLGAAEQPDGLEQLLPEPEEPLVLEPEPAAGEDGVIDVGAASQVEGLEPEAGAVPIFSADQVSDLVDQAMTQAPGDIPIPLEKPATPDSLGTTVAPVEESAQAAIPASSGDGLSFSDVAASLGGEGDSAPAQTEQNVPDAETTTAAAAADPEAAAGGGGYWVQIAAYSSREVAAEAWDRLARDQADLLASVSPRVMETSVAGTTLHRLQVGEYTSQSAAQQLCDALKQRQIDCMIVGP